MADRIKQPQLVYYKSRGTKNGFSSAIYPDGYFRSVELSITVLKVVDISPEDAKLSLAELAVKHPYFPQEMAQNVDD